jgi:hypothetical protein
VKYGTVPSGILQNRHQSRIFAARTLRAALRVFNALRIFPRPGGAHPHYPKQHTELIINWPDIHADGQA